MIIIYLVQDEQPEGVEIIGENVAGDARSWKYIENAIKRENSQRNLINEGIKDASDDDIILVSDVDEIPNLENLNLYKIKEKIIFFKQSMFHYKFNLYIPNFYWYGSRGCKKKYLINPQWLRNIKDRKYPFYRIDTLFSKNKYIDINIVENGGWHFSNIKTAKDIELKLSSYLHHIEFEEDPLSESDINKIMSEKKAIYDLKVDKRIKKMGDGTKLERYELNKLPIQIQKNIKLYENWLD